jgi:hypothetical protein
MSRTVPAFADDPRGERGDEWMRWDCSWSVKGIWAHTIWAHTRALRSLRTPALAAETGLARPTPPTLPLATDAVDLGGAAGATRGGKVACIAYAPDVPPVR